MAKHIWQSLHAVYHRLAHSRPRISLFEFNPASQVYMTREPVVYVCDTSVGHLLTLPRALTSDRLGPSLCLICYITSGKFLGCSKLQGACLQN